MYGRSALFYDRLYGGNEGNSFRNPRKEAERVVQEVRQWCPDATTLLDVGCGSGRYLPFVAERYRIHGIDLNPDLLDVAREHIPGAAFDVADMTDFELGQRFDIITCLFSSIAYVVTLERLRATLERMAAHLRPGGVVIIEPWFTPDTFWDGHVVSNYLDEPDLHVAWMYRQERSERLSVLPIHYLLSSAEGVEYFTERHELGLFTHEEYTASMESVGLRVTHDPLAFGRGLYVGVSPR
jgi:SAM-dependent methyltransferase